MELFFLGDIFIQSAKVMAISNEYKLSIDYLLTAGAFTWRQVHYKDVIFGSIVQNKKYSCYESLVREYEEYLFVCWPF